MDRVAWLILSPDPARQVHFIVDLVTIMPMVKVSDQPGSRSVYGTFLGWDNDDGHCDMLVAAVGAGYVRMAPGLKVSRGDLVESAGNGCARVQADDVIRASTIGKISAAIVVETHPDGSFVVPCILHCG